MSAVVRTGYLLVQDNGKIIDIPRQPLSPEQDAELHAFLAGQRLAPRTAQTLRPRPPR